MRTLPRFVLTWFVPFALAVCLGGGCALAPVGAGLLLQRDVLPGDVHTAEVALDVEQVWPAAQAALRELALRHEMALVDYPRRLRAEVDKAQVTVTVEAYDLKRTLIKVEAVRLLASDKVVAERVMNAILTRLGIPEQSAATPPAH